MSVIAAPPDVKVTTGVDIVSEAVNVRVISSLAIASVVVELLEAMLTELSVGAVVSAAVNVALEAEIALFVAMLTELSVGAVVSKLAVTLVEFDVAVTAVPAFPAVSL